MYLDCQTCRYQSKHFLALGEETIRGVAENILLKDGGKIHPDLLCPNGHPVDILPSVCKWLGNYAHPGPEGDNPCPTK